MRTASQVAELAVQSDLRLAVGVARRFNPVKATFAPREVTWTTAFGFFLRLVDPVLLRDDIAVNVADSASPDLASCLIHWMH